MNKIMPSFTKNSFALLHRLHFDLCTERSFRVNNIHSVKEFTTPHHEDLLSFESVIQLKIALMM